MFRSFLFALAMLVAAPLFAAEGDFIGEYGNSQGEWIVREYQLCDDDHSSDTTCNEIDLSSVTNASSINPYGLPVFIVAEIESDNCDINSKGFLVGLTASGGTRHQLHGVSMEEGTNVSAVTINPLSHRFVAYDITTLGSTGSCNDFEVVLRAFWDRGRMRGQR